jgi:WD40 repeat protein
MQNCVLTDARLDSCAFDGANLSNLKYGRYPDFIAHESVIDSIAFSPDGKFLVSGGHDKTLRLWNIELQKEIAVF